MTGNTGFSYKGGSIDDQIVCDAIGGAGENLEAEVLSPRRPVANSKKRTRQIVALMALLVVGGSGVLFFKGQGVPVSADVAKLIARSEDAAAQMASGTAAPAAPAPAVAPSVATEPSPVEPVASVPAAGPVAGAVAPESSPVAASVVPVAPTSVPVAIPEKPVAPDPVAVQEAVNAAMGAMQADLKGLEEQIAGKKKELSALDEKIAAAKKTVSSLASAAAKATQPPKETRTQATAPVKPAATKQAAVPQQGLNRVFAILGDGVVLMDGDVVSVGESSPKIGGILTRVNASANQVEISGTTRNVLVEQR